MRTLLATIVLLTALPHAHENDLKGKPAEFATPAVLLRLAKAHDRMFTY